jgi:hypothetical protein
MSSDEDEADDIEAADDGPNASGKAESDDGKRASGEQDPADTQNI